jgi:hypothetical protein
MCLVATQIGLYIYIYIYIYDIYLCLYTYYLVATQIGFAEGTSVLQAQQAMAVFSFFLFLVYGFFGSVLAIFRNDVVKQGMY